MHRALVLSTILAAAACGKEPAEIPAEKTAVAARVHVGGTDQPTQKSLRADVSDCRSAGTPTGQGHVKITYDANGKPVRAEVDDPLFANTHTGWCVADRFLQIAKLDPMKYGATSAEASFTF